LALGEFISRSHWQANRWPRLLFGSFAVLMLIVHAIGLPWYAEARSPVRQAEMVQSFIGEPATAVASYPRDCNSVAYLLGRSDFDTVRSKDVNELMVAMHHRPRTVVLFTHRHSYEAFKAALPPSLTIRQTVSLRRKPSGVAIVDKLVGDTPWGLVDMAVIVPTPGTPAVIRGQQPAK
ncbi:MAG: ArnT family glycosyltransferase, partial [Gemmataceae bacterium]